MSTVNFKYPVTTATGPTVAQAMNCNMVVAEVVCTDADTTAVITHNWQTSTANLAFFFPIIQYYIGTAGTANPILSFALTNSLIVTMTKVSAAGSGGTYVVVLQRPMSMIT